MPAFKFVLMLLALICLLLILVSGREDVWTNIPCNKEYWPENCDLNVSNAVTLEDLDRCGPARIPLSARNYFLGTAGRGITYKDNKDAFDRIRMKPKMLRDVSMNSIETTVLGMKVDFPIGLSPVALHKLAHPDGEKATVAGVSPMHTVMILSSFASTSIEDVAAAAAAHGNTLHLWMQVYIFQNRSITLQIVRRAERSGFKALVLTSDSPIDGTLSCDGRMSVSFPPGVKSENVDYFKDEYDISTNFRDITWLRSNTRLPIVAKGLLSGDDSIRAILAGASAILVSNHGGRQMDGVPATIDALPAVVSAMNTIIPPREVYMDGGVRSGSDVYKAIARGARMVFYGRPNIWGLALGGADGVRAVINTLKTQFNETMLLAGISRVQDISRDTLMSSRGTNCDWLVPDDYN